MLASIRAGMPLMYTMVGAAFSCINLILYAIRHASLKRICPLLKGECPVMSNL